MPSLRHLLASHRNLLVVDCASARVQLGLLAAASETRWSSTMNEAAAGLFDCTGELLGAAGKRITDIDAFVFCEGPGSVLGIRMSAVAIRSWRVICPSAAVYSYQSLDVVARSINRPGVGVIADARRESWHVARVGEPLCRLPTSALSGELVMPAHFRHWTALPADVATTGYDVEELFGRLPDADIFRVSEAPDAFLHEDPAYVTWTPRVHQAPAAPAN